VRYIIYGAGGIGGAIGGRLFQNGREVVLIARGDHLERMRANGLRLIWPSGDERLSVPVAGHPSEIEWQPDDVVILTMKTQHTASAPEDLRAAVGDVPVICGQNGVANERMAARQFTRVYGMVVVLPAVFLEPGVVMVNADTVGGMLDSGLYPGGVDPLITDVMSDIADSGFAAQPDDDVMRLKYAKLLSNLANAVQALCGTDAAAGDIVREVRSEALACYEAAGIESSPADLGQRSAKLTFGQIEGQTRQGGSTWQSLERGAGSIETDYLNGEITLLGALHGVPTPYNRVLQVVAAEAVRERREPGSYSVEELVERAKNIGA
jgi:2-dehydropantoate 2-reductase